MIPVCICFIIFVIFDEQAYIANAEHVLAVFVLLMLFGCEFLTVVSNNLILFYISAFYCAVCFVFF